MKKVVTLILAGCLAMFAMTACSSKSESSSVAETKKYDVNAVAQTIGEVVTFEESMDISEAYIEYLKIPTENIESFAGKYCRLGDANSFNIVLVIEAKDGYADEVKSAIEAKKEAVSAESDLYSQETVDRLDSSVVYANGNYIVWSTCGTTDDMTAAYDAVDSAISTAFAG